MPAPVRTPEKDEAFFHAIEERGGNVTAALRVSRYTRSSVYGWVREDPYFRARFEEAKDLGADRLEDEARRRAYNGVRTPVYHKGEKVGHIRKYSDTLIIFLLKATRPEKYRERFDVTLPPALGAVLNEVQNSNDLAQLRRLAAESQGRIAELLAKESVAPPKEIAP